MRVAWIAVVVSVTGCAAQESPSDFGHDACASLAVHGDGLTAAQSDELAVALALWTGHGPSSLGVEGGASVELRFEDAAPSFLGLYAHEEGVIYINSRMTDPAAISIVIAHEVGHALGLPHVDGHGSVMIRGNTAVQPSAQDTAALEALWGECPATSSSAPPGS
jgi:hypothetical protein